LKDNYIFAQQQMCTKLAIISPLINLNACCTEIFLKSNNILQEFENEFGKLKIGMEEPIHKDPNIATWIWEKSIPFTDVANKIAKINKGKIATCTYRLSIGAILFTRNFWKEIGYFTVAEIGSMGAEEEQVNAYCTNKMYSIIISEDILAGHLGFFNQKDACEIFYGSHKKEIVE
jgi:hypothetical protein